MALMKKLKKMVDKVVDFMTEDVDETEKVEEISREVRKSARQVEAVEKKIEAATVKPVEEKPVKPVEKKIKPVDPTPFVSVGNNETKPVEAPRPKPAIVQAEPIREKESVYVPRDVISPIFGAPENATQRYSTSPMVQYDEEVPSESVIGTIFSPINGKSVPKAVADDEVSQQVASLTTTDFIEKITDQPSQQEQSVFLDAQYNTVSVQNLTVPDPEPQPVSEEIVSPQPIIRPQSDDSEEGYENLSLF